MALDAPPRNPVAPANTFVVEALLARYDGPDTDQRVRWTVVGWATTAAPALDYAKSYPSRSRVTAPDGTKLASFNLTSIPEVTAP